MTVTAPPVAAVDGEFPVAWADPADAERPWMRDRLHNPGQVTPLAHDIVGRCFGDGAVKGMQAYSAPIAGWDALRLNTYTYNCITPVTGTPEEMAAFGARAEVAMRDAMGRMLALWEQDLLPEIHEHLAVWEAFDLPGASTEALLRHLDDTLVRFTRLCEIHMLAITPANLAISELDECSRGLFGELPDFGVFDAYKLVQGYPNKTVEVGHELWRLSRAALAVPEVAAALQQRRDTAETLSDLATTGAGEGFLATLGTYLEGYGQRGDLFFDLDRPAWVEDPTPVLDGLRSYMAQPDGADPALVAAALADERETVLAAARAGMAGYPAPVRGQFEFLLEAASTGVVVTEDHGFWIDFRSSYKVRQVLLEAGRRLVSAGQVAAPDDVFMLTLDEVRAALAVAAASDSGAPTEAGLSSVVDQRRDEMARFATVRPPDGVGAPPPPPPPVENPFSRFMTKFFGAGPGGPGPAGGARAADEPGVVRGNPGSPGRVTGVARIIRSIAEADRLGAGDILVAETTTPPWTPLFAIAGAVVTDTGGVLSHCAVVAREYGLPAVVGTGRGTDRIRDGMVIEVDGDAGTVLLPQDSAS